MSNTQDMHGVIAHPMTDQFVAQGMAVIVPPVMKLTKPIIQTGINTT